MAVCPECGHENEETATDCANCLRSLHLAPEPVTSKQTTDSHRRSAVVFSRQEPWAILIAKIAILIVGFVSFFGPWGWSEMGLQNGWTAALYWTLWTIGLCGLLYAGLVLYSASVLIGLQSGWIFWIARVPLVLWLFVGSSFVMEGNMRYWRLSATWGAWVFVASVALANAIEAVALIHRGRRQPTWIRLVAGIVGTLWLSLNLILVPGRYLWTRTQVDSVGEPVSTEELVSRIERGERGFGHGVFKGVQLPGAYLGEFSFYESNLQEANLSEAILLRTNLVRANLDQADLSGANLRAASLSGAYLHRADLSRADLLGASLEGANLTEASLEQANLREASLIYAALRGANLTDADLSGANLRGAVVSSAQLSRVKSLSRATMPDGSVHE